METPSTIYSAAPIAFLVQNVLVSHHGDGPAIIHIRQHASLRFSRRVLCGQPLEMEVSIGALTADGGWAVRFLLGFLPFSGEGLQLRAVQVGYCPETHPISGPAHKIVSVASTCCRQRVGRIGAGNGV